MKLVNNCPYTCTVHTNACSHSIYIRIVAPYSDLGTGACLTGNALDLNGTVSYLCNLGLEKSLYKTGMCSGNQDTRSLRCILNFKNVNFYSLSWLEGLTLYLFVLCKYCVCLTKVDADIFAHYSLNNTGYHFFFDSIVLIVKNFTLFLTDFLKNDILCILGCDTSEFLGLDLNLHNITDLCVRVCFLCIHQRNLQRRILHMLYNSSVSVNTEVTGLRIDHNVNVICLSEMVLTCLDQ